MQYHARLGHDVLNLYLTWYQELCNFDICQKKDKCSSFHMILFHLYVSFPSLILLMHQDYWASEISLFSVVSTSAVGSVCPWDSWQSPFPPLPRLSFPLHVSFCLTLSLFGPSDNFLHFPCHILVSLALQSSVPKRMDTAFSTLGAKSVCSWLT